MKPPLDLRLYAVLDPARCHGRPLPQLAAAAARGGATLLQYRDKRSQTRRLVSNTRAIIDALAPFGVPLLVNDRIDVALAAGAAGAHVGQHDMAPGDARRLLGPDAILGVTIHHAHETQTLTFGVADYAGCGPVYATSSKEPGDPPLGPEGLHRLLGDLPPGLPACGIAGIDHRNAHAVIEAGAAGVAVISDIFMAEDVLAATRRLRAAVDMALAAKGAP